MEEEEKEFTRIGWEEAEHPNVMSTNMVWKNPTLKVRPPNFLSLDGLFFQHDTVKINLCM